MQMNVDIRGFRELDRALGELPKATARNVLRRVTKAALDPMATVAAGAAPHQTGRLSFSISVSERGTRRAEWYGSRARFVAPGVFRSDPKTSFTMAMGPAGGTGALSYASFAEFGTIDTPAHPYMRPAWDGGKDAALQHVKVSLGREIDMAAGRLARRAARRA